MSFAIGQRWISETENSLGLGMITDLDFRSVTLHFPATDETRIYAVAQAGGRVGMRVNIRSGRYI